MIKNTAVYKDIEILQNALVNLIPYREEGYGLRQKPNIPQRSTDLLCDSVVLTVLRMYREYLGLKPKEVLKMLNSIGVQSSIWEITSIERAAVSYSHRKLSEYLCEFSAIYNIKPIEIAAIAAFFYNENFSYNDMVKMMGGDLNVAIKDFLHWILRVENIRFSFYLESVYFRETEFRHLQQKFIQTPLFDFITEENNAKADISSFVKQPSTSDKEQPNPQPADDQKNFYIPLEQEAQIEKLKIQLEQANAELKLHRKGFYILLDWYRENIESINLVGK